MNHRKAETLQRSNDMTPVAGTIEIDVPVDVLWQAFTDAKSWPKWNRCFFWVRNRDLKLGDKLMWVFQPIKWWLLYKMPAMATIIEMEKHKKVTWEVTVLPGFYAHHTYHMEALGAGRSRFGSWEKACGWSFRLLKKFWLRHFVFVKDCSLEGAKTLEAFFQRTGRIGFDVAKTNVDFVRRPAVSGGRTKRRLRVSEPEIHAFRTRDGENLRLTRFRGGDKGPVLCSHGLGVSSAIFSTDLIETNLLEFLYKHGYDVWLLDYRASIDLPCAHKPATGDDIALFDYPAAVQTVRDLTGAAGIQMVVHCYGATTWTMAMLAGLQGVHSAVCSQVAAHARAPFMTKLKTGLHVPGVLDALGIDSLTAYTDRLDDWPDHLFNKLLKLYPLELEERCSNPVCHRITFLYSLLYEHDQLNDQLHVNLDELFGVANIEQFEHIARIVRKGHVVAANGDDRYLAHLDRLALPITFIHGAENECFLPESTELTFNALRERNGASLYHRHVIPNYGHIDCIFGKNAARDVYPHILAHFEATQPTH